MAFGAFGSNTAATGGLFGSTQPAAAKPAFSFGAATTTASTGFGGFGNAFGTTAAPAAATGSLFGGFGTAATTQAAKPGGLFGGFGTAATTTQSGFGGFGTTGTTFGGFGQTKTTASTFPSFGSTTTTESTGFGGFGGIGATSALGGFGTTALQPQQQLQADANPLGAMASALTSPNLFGDERDSIIAKLNQILALWGVGKGYYATNAAPITFTTDNIFCRFKSIGYSCLPSSKDEDGLVALELKHKLSSIKTNQQQLVESLQKVLGSKPTLVVCVEDLRELTPETSEVIFYVVQREANGTSKKIAASELFTFLNQGTAKTQLQGLGVTNILPRTTLTESQLKSFLSTPPLGIDNILWEQAKKDNPNPEKLIPVPIVGFSELINRLKHQQYQTEQYQKRLSVTGDEISSLKASHTATLAKLAQYKRKHLELGHRVLDIMITQETARKSGYAMEPEEEHLRVRVESLHSELTAPMQFRGRLNELMAQIRLHSQTGSSSFNQGRTNLDDHTKYEVLSHLKQQQSALTELIAIIRSDFNDLKLVEDGLYETNKRPS